VAGDGLTVAVQPQARGTGDAVAAARESLADFDGDVLVLSGDSPLLTPELLKELVDAHEPGTAATVLTFEPQRPLPYGRVIRGENGNVRAIVEEGDASEEERAIRELNSSTYVFDPLTVLRGKTRVGRGAEVGPHVVAVDAEIGERSLVGPFCYLRPGTVLQAGAKAGTFVEIKNSTIGEGTKVPHLSYLGDAEIGEGTNIGAGAITANFPHPAGRPKGRTTIGRNVRTGVDNAF